MSWCAWGRLWQWFIQIPGFVAVKATCHLSPGRTSKVSTHKGLPDTLVPSLDRMSTGWPCRCQGWVSRLRLTTVNRTRSPSATSWSGIAGCPRPLTVWASAGRPSTTAAPRSRTIVKCRSKRPSTSKGTAAGVP
jgi:hypothetical protein